MRGRVQEEDDSFTRWIEACAAGELLGIASAALWWVTVSRFDSDPSGDTAQTIMFLLKASSGLIQGLVLGYLQGWALRRPYPQLSAGRWATATVLVALGGWGLAAWYSVYGTADPDLGVRTLLQTAVNAAGFGVATGLLFGAVQAFVLRGVAHNAHWWILLNVAGWGLALPCIYIASSLGSAHPGSLEIAFRGLVGGVASGVVLGAVTGLSFKLMAPRYTSEPQPRF